MHREGIEAVTPADLAAARAAGCVVKPPAVCERAADAGSVAVRVHPAMVPVEHPLAAVGGADNAVVVEAAASGRLMVAGPGAGGPPTAGAVLGDLVAAGRNRLAGVTGPAGAARHRLPVAPVAEALTRRHLALEVTDSPTALGAVSAVLGEHGVTVATAAQLPGEAGLRRLTLTTGRAPDGAVTAALAALRATDRVRRVAGVMRVEDG